MKNVLIEYTLKPGMDVEDIKPAIEKLVAGLREHGGGALYTSYRKQGDAPSFAHVGAFPDEAQLAKAQQMPFFGEFAGFLKARCAEGPSVTNLSVVASTVLDD